MLPRMQSFDDSKTGSRRAVPLVLIGALLLACAPNLSFAADSELSAMDKTFLEFLRDADIATTSIFEVATDGLTSPAKKVEIPDWLTGPVTGKIMGEELPLSIEKAVDLALKHNFGLQSSKLDVAISASEYKQERYEFVPFVDLLSGVQYTDTKTGIETGSGLERTNQSEGNVGVRVTQNLPTGGDLSLQNTVSRFRIDDEFRVETVDPETGRVTDVSRDSMVTREYENSLEFTARQPLLRGGGFSVGLANLRLSRLNNISSDLSDYIRRRDVALSVIQQYVFILQRQMDARVSIDAIVEKEDFLSETQLKVDFGEIAETEIGRAEISLLNEQERSERLRRSFLDSRDGLLVLIGAPLDSPLRLREEIPEIVELSELGLADREMCVREALSNRPELIQSDISIRRANINLQLAKNGVLPFLDLEGSYSDSENGRHLRDANSLDDSRRWSIGAFLDIPFPNMANREALKRSRYRLEQAHIARRRLELDISDQVHRLFRALGTNSTRVKVLEKSVALAELNLKQVNIRFYEGEGNTTIIDIRSAQDDLFENRTVYNNARLQYYSDLASLYRAIGRPLFAEEKQPLGLERAEN